MSPDNANIAKGSRGNQFLTPIPRLTSILLFAVSNSYALWCLILYKINFGTKSNFNLITGWPQNSSLLLLDQIPPILHSKNSLPLQSQGQRKNHFPTSFSHLGACWEGRGAVQDKSTDLEEKPVTSGRDGGSVGAVQILLKISSNFFKHFVFSTKYSSNIFWRKIPRLAYLII